MSKPLIWVHGDCLNPHSPALIQYPDAPRVFVFDLELLSSYRLSLKRVVFLYECLLEIPGIEIRKGDVAAELALVAREQGCDRVITTGTVAPRFKGIAQRVRDEFGLQVEIVELDAFAGIGTGEIFDLKRFSRYWEKVKSRALTLNRSFDW